MIENWCVYMDEYHLHLGGSLKFGVPGGGVQSYAGTHQRVPGTRMAES